MVELKEIQKFCEGKKIIIVGNSSRLLNHNYGSLIDSYDIVVRINRGYLQHNLYTNMIGSKTTIVSIGVKSAAAALGIVGRNNLAYVLSPIIWSEKLQLQNGYDVKVNDYNILKDKSNTNKPSTGISTYNFFNNLNNFKRLDLIGFDFFESSIRHINHLGHTKVFDHDGSKELLFFEKVKDSNKTKLHIMKEDGIPPPNNIPRIPTNRKYTVKIHKAK